jgi:cobalt transporter subunit CbtB
MSVRTGSVTRPMSGAAVPLLVLLLGLATILMLGFVPGSMLHEFVHDARHLLAFPCH